MASVSVTNLSGVQLTISNVGTLAPHTSRTASLTGAQLENIQDDLTSLQESGKITFTVNTDPNVSDLAELAVAGANRQTVGPFAETTAASQTNNVVSFGGAAVGWVANRSGSIAGFSAVVDVAVTGAAFNCRIAKNGTPIAATQLDFTVSPANTKDYATFDLGTHTFVAGDVLTVVYTSAVTTNTPVLVATIEIAD